MVGGGRPPQCAVFGILSARHICENPDLAAIPPKKYVHIHPSIHLVHNPVIRVGPGSRGGQKKYIGVGGGSCINFRVQFNK